MVVTDRDVVVPSPALLKRVSWGAIFAGSVIVVALTALFSLLGLGIGFGAADPTRPDGFADIPKGTLAWWAVTTILATGIGAFVAARLAGIPRGLTGAFHGLAVWSVATLVMLWLATTAVGTVLGAATSAVTTTARVATDVVGAAGGVAVRAGEAAAPSGSEIDRARAGVQREADEVLSSAGVGQSNLERAQEIVGQTAQNIAVRPGTASEEINRLIDRLFTGPNAALTPQEREQLINELSQRTGVSREEAGRIADRWQSQATAAREQTIATAQQVRTRAGEMSGDVLDAMSKVAWGMFLISLAGLVAALIGAAIGGASLGLGLVAAGAAAAADDRRYEEDEEHFDHDRPPPPRGRR